MNKREFEATPENERMNRILDGVAFFACLHKPNTAAAKRFKSLPFFGVNLGLDEENIAKATSYGLKVHPANASIPMPYVKLHRKVKEGVDPEKVKPILIDTNQKPIPPTELIGNGSLLKCKFGTSWYDTQGGGVTAYLFKTQVKKLERFVPTDKDFLNDGSGYVADEQVLADDTMEPEFDA